MNLLTRPGPWNYDLARPGLENAFNHKVRSRMESRVCEWLMKRSIAHRHGTEPFVLKVSEKKYETYVPDIVLHDKRGDKRVVIGILPVDSQRKGRTMILASFRKYWAHEYFLILITKNYSGVGIAKGAFDLLVDVKELDVLENELPPPPEEYLNDSLLSTR